MRTTPPPIHGLVWGSLGAIAALLGLLGALLAGLPGAGVGLAGAGAGAALLHRRAARRWQGRRAALAEPLPEAWRALLRDWCDHYHRLPEGLRARFEDDLRIFLAEKRITGIGVEVIDEHRLLVAASAVTLSLGWPDYDWEQVGEILLYPDDFDRDYAIGSDERAGEAHPWGTIILSIPALCDSFRDPDDGYHLGFHEFAHLLDLEQTHFDGTPAAFGEAESLRWAEIRDREMARMQEDDSILDDYGADDPVEFLGVAVEGFFEAPLAIRRDSPDLYAILTAYFGQDPAAWDDARGLVLPPPRPIRRRRAPAGGRRRRLRP